MRCTGVTRGEVVAAAFTLHGDFYQMRKLTRQTCEDAIKDRAFEGGKEEALNEAGKISSVTVMSWVTGKDQKWEGCLRTSGKSSSFGLGELVL